jgi:L-threonylcarbamoyladenylate synthase
MTEDLKIITDALRQGKLIVVNTGLGMMLACDATNAGAVSQILGINSSWLHSTVTLLFDETSRLTNYIDELSDIAWDLLDLAVEPLILILSGFRNIDMRLTDENGFARVSVVAEQHDKNICRSLRKPLAAFPVTDVDLIGENEHVVYVQKVESKEHQEKKQKFSVIRLEKGNQFKIIS